jgi:glucosamine--fructose-6-phosphate aminotransferase (isomerizing)
MAKQEREMTLPLIENILSQPEAIRAAAAYHFGEGQQALLQSSALLRSSQRIILSGMGGSLSACIPLSHYLASKGVLVPVIETSELLHSYAPAIDENTAVILVSRSGETVEVTKLLPVLKQRKAAVIGVTNAPRSTLDSSSTQSVWLHSPPDQLVAIQTYTATVLVLLLLGAAFLNELNANLRSELDTTVNALSSWIPECFQSSDNWSSFLEAASPLYLLGRGASLASVAEGVLLLHEVAKAPAVGMSAADFRHGPVEVVDDRFHGIIFGSQKETAELDAALAENVTGMKGNVRWIGPRVAGRKIVPLCPWPANAPDRFASVFEIIPIQIAAYRIAESRSIIPGEFRHAPAITLSETGFSDSGLV